MQIIFSRTIKLKTQRNYLRKCSLILAIIWKLIYNISPNFGFCVMNFFHPWWGVSLVHVLSMVYSQSMMCVRCPLMLDRVATISRSSGTSTRTLVNASGSFTEDVTATPTASRQKKNAKRFASYDPTKVYPCLSCPNCFCTNSLIHLHPSHLSCVQSYFCVYNRKSPSILWRR